MRRQTETTSAGLSFPCECKGCMGRNADLDSVWQVEQIPGRLEGYYFSDGARRFFHSRLLSFRHLADGALAVRESLAGDMDNVSRVHQVTIWCRYGHILPRELAGDTYTTGAKAAAAMQRLAGAADSCECHGCALDRVGR